MNTVDLRSAIVLVCVVLLVPQVESCDVMGARACGQKPNKDDQENDPVKYCVASRVYFECVHKKYRGCENKEKYEVAMESMMKGIRKRVDELLGFCSDKIEDYNFKINWDPPKPAEAPASARSDGGSKRSGHGSSAVQPSTSDDLCQVKTINDLCQPLMSTSKFNPSWNSFNKRSWCQQSSAYYRCLKSRLDRCPQPDVQNQFQPLERYLISQVNINCPGGVNGCTRHATDARCKIGTSQSNARSMAFPSASLLTLSVVLLLWWL